MLVKFKILQSDIAILDLILLVTLLVFCMHLLVADSMALFDFTALHCKFLTTSLNSVPQDIIALNNKVKKVCTVYELAL